MKNYEILDEKLPSEVCQLQRNGAVAPEFVVTSDSE